MWIDAKQNLAGFKWLKINFKCEKKKRFSIVFLSKGNMSVEYMEKNSVNENQLKSFFKLS